MLLLFSKFVASLIEKISIIGSGIAGLGVGASINQLNTNVKETIIFENKVDALQSTLGGGLQLSGGAAVLEKLDCLQDLYKSSEKFTGVVNRNAQGEILFKLDITGLIKKYASSELCSDDGRGDPMMFSIMRNSLLSLLFKATSAKKSKTKITIKTNKKCIKITEDNETGKVKLYFDDGTTEDNNDLVIGADGIQSIAKKFILNENKKLSNDPIVDIEDDDVQYSGLRITFCVTPEDRNLSVRKESRGVFNQWMGDGGYALTSSYGGKNGFFLKRFFL
jgi:2-polyprenyl-6-methoxyphenol hydroxylase-like FAD-dependent oxidoreductase